MSETDTIKSGEPTETYRAPTVGGEPVPHILEAIDKQSEEQADAARESEKAIILANDPVLNPSHAQRAADTAFRNNTTPAYKAIWQHLINQRIVVQEKGGNIVIGLFVGKDEGYLKLENAEIHGRTTIVKPGPVWIDRTAINHMHKQTDNVEKKGKS